MDWLKGQVSCRACGELLAVGSLTSHMMTQHGRVADTRQKCSTLIILEEGNFFHPRCAWCDMLVSRRALKGRHLTTAQCARGEEWKIRRLVEVETRESAERAFEAYGEPIKNFSAIRYLGKVMT